MKLKYASGMVPGSFSAKQKTESQDRIKITDENGVAVISLTDTAGMTEKPRFSADLTAEAATAIMAESFDELYVSKDDAIKKAVFEKIMETFQSTENKFSGMDGALICIVIKENRYLAAHMGGGLIARLNGSCSILSKPENDLPSEETYTTEDLVMTKLRIYKGNMQKPFGFMLISEGACKSLYDGSTGNLSSACDSFFEWLKEYDEETVSEALTENINKYFLKDTNGDIGVVVIVSDEDETKESMEENETYQEGINSAKRYGKNKDLKYILIAMFIVLVIIISKLMQPNVIDPEQEGKTDSNPPAPPVTYSENYEPTVSFSVENPISYDAGEYKVGVDIPAGEYFFWTGEMLKPGSIVVNDDTCLSDELYCMTIQLNEWDTLVSDYRFTPAEYVNPVKATKGILISGKYKIGKDIAPGEYTVSPKNKNAEGRYYSIFDEEISNDTEISDETTVEVPEEGYVVIYNSVLVVEQ